MSGNSKIADSHKKKIIKQKGRLLIDFLLFVLGIFLNEMMFKMKSS